MRLKELRKEHKKLQREIAEVINCSQAVYSRYESEEREPSSDILATLANYYGVTVDYILDREQQNKKPTVVSESNGVTDSSQRSPEAQAIIDEIMAKILAIPDDAKIQVLNFADFIKTQEDAKK